MLPGTSLPLNLICTRWDIASLGIKDAWNCLLPLFCTLHGMVPSLTIISRFPDPALAASTVHEELVIKAGFYIWHLGLPLMIRPLNFIWIRCNTGSLGIKEPWNWRLPRFCTLHGIVPSFTMISRLPDPAFAASTRDTIDDNYYDLFNHKYFLKMSQKCNHFPVT